MFTIILLRPSTSSGLRRIDRLVNSSPHITPVEALPRSGGLQPRTPEEWLYGVVGSKPFFDDEK